MWALFLVFPLGIGVFPELSSLPPLPVPVGYVRLVWPLFDTQFSSVQECDLDRLGFPWISNQVEGNFPLLSALCRLTWKSEPFPLTHRAFAVWLVR